MSTAEEKGFTLNISGSQKAESSVNSNENFSELKGKQAPVKKNRRSFRFQQGSSSRLRFPGYSVHSSCRKNPL